MESPIKPPQEKLPAPPTVDNLKIAVDLASQSIRQEIEDLERVYKVQVHSVQVQHHHGQPHVQVKVQIPHAIE